LKRKGFTLIELLVVIAIIAILAAILFPVFAKARSTAKKAGCQSNLKQLGIALQSYIQDWDEKFPIGCNGTPGLMGMNGTWAEGLYPYVEEMKVFRCTEVKQINKDWYPVTYLINDVGTFVRYAGGTYLTYSFLAFGEYQGEWQGVTGLAPNVGAPAFPGGIATKYVDGMQRKIYLCDTSAAHRTVSVFYPSWRRPSGGMWFLNACFQGPMIAGTYTPHPTDAEWDESTELLWPNQDEWITDGGTGWLEYDEGWSPHNGIGNYLYCDGHVEAHRADHNLYEGLADAFLLNALIQGSSGTAG